MKFKLRYFLWHLLVSLGFALVALYFVFGVWYPSPLGAAAGVTVIFLILLGVDVVIGPLLTLLVAKEKKKSLKFDLGSIVVLQVIAFAYGIYTLALGRPEWIVFNAGRFDLVQAYQIDSSYALKAKAEYRVTNWLGPTWVAARLPDDAEERNNLVFESVVGGSDVPQRPDLYVPYEAELENVKRAALSLNNLNQFNSPAKVATILEDWPDANAYLPMMARAKPMTVLLKRETGQVLGVVSLNPW